MYRKHFFQILSVLRVSSVNFTDKLWYTKYIIREVILKDIAAPPWEQLGTPTPWIPMVLASPQILTVCNCPVIFMVSWFVGVSSHLCSCVMAQWWSSHQIGSVFLLQCFVYACIPWWQGEGWGLRWGGPPTLAGAVLADILVIFMFRVIFTIFGIRSRLCSCLLAVDRGVVGTHDI